MKKIFAILALLTVVVARPAHATEIVRELWDNIPGGALKGAANGTTSLGFPGAAKWTPNPSDTAVSNVFQMDTFDDAYDWVMGVFPLLPASATVNGTLAMIGNNTNGWDSGSWAVRLMSSSVSFTTSGTYYFSARFVKRGLWFNSNGTNGYGPDDAALGFGLSSGSASNSHFVGAGITRSYSGNGGGGYLTSDGSTDIGDSIYLTTGTLGQTGYANHPGDSGGPFFVRAAGFAQEVEGYIGGYPDLGSAYVSGGFVVFRLITTPSGNSELDAKIYVSPNSVDTDPTAVTWDTTYTFTETASMQFLLVWMYGNNNANPCWLDGIRMANTWAEAVGAEVIGPPSVSPTNSVYAGTPVTLSVLANVDAADASYQWRKNGTNIPNEFGIGTSFASYSLTNTTPADGGNYSLVFSNYYGVPVTSQVQTLTVLPSVPPYFVSLSTNATRYSGGGVSFTATINGAPPFTYQWGHVVGGVTNLVAGPIGPISVFSNVLTITGLQLTDAGSYVLSVSNSIGATNSIPVVLSVNKPTGYAAAVAANNPYGYWPMNETTGTTVHDYWNGHDGTVLDPTNATIGVAGAPYFGFASTHDAVAIPLNGAYARVNLPALPLLTNHMTFACWVFTPGANDEGFILNRDYNNNGGYGNAYGLEFVFDGIHTTTLGYQWGGGDVNPSSPFLGHTWTNSNLQIPLSTWTFVALVLDGTQATIYMGTNTTPFTVGHASLPSAVDTTFPGTSYSNTNIIMVGRHGWPWAEDPAAGNTNSWAGANVTMSDVSIFYSSLSSSNVYELYLAGVGELITYTNSTGNLVLNWPYGHLQAATNVVGPYNPVVGAVSPYTNAINSPQKFFRVTH